MKAAPFAYVRPGTVADVVAELSQEGSKVIAGGQSLVPVLAMRLGRPAQLIDINAVRDLNGLALDRGALRVGATVRQRRMQREQIAAGVPLVRLALPWVGHREVRSRGTVCGSIAHADPSAELPAVAACLEATMVLTSQRGTRQVSAADFFTGALSTVAEPDELLSDVVFPVAKPGEGFGFGEFARRHGDFALAGVAVRVRTSEGSVDARLTCFGVSDVPVTVDVSQQLRAALEKTGSDPSRPDLQSALAAHTPGVAAVAVNTGGDSHASPGYRRRLISVLAAREVSRAYVSARLSESEERSR
ncbi:carbon-monoxide dehydrogenase medium subunit [Nocardioides luteus]|uniref:Carbon monoxide dehydrogenase n=1 Tax=Nocardioides luteus TaxID=1844 RepID=A0ABQ5T389_9ACTN|nr:FAD binding domain-containing protein [Nocardioides luteus]MDR7310179.1 carbon-monoxide dehydrogenase medium subunit [Nocardioides luteus]GGR69349.1 carbon monoxide dehydrogenase [Nocardioides luteus]GLJ70353.1 carbon monoxide dehydrogenase [Nocardioides luteus]